MRIGRAVAFATMAFIAFAQPALSQGQRNGIAALALPDPQSTCALCGRPAHHCLDDLVATSPPGDVLDPAQGGLKLHLGSCSLALARRPSRSTPRRPASFQPRGPPFTV